MLCIEMIYKRGTMEWECASAQSSGYGIHDKASRWINGSRQQERSVASGESDEEGLDPGKGYLRVCWWFLEMEQLSGMDVGCVGVFYNGGSIGEQINDFKYSKIELG